MNQCSGKLEFSRCGINSKEFPINLVHFSASEHLIKIMTFSFSSKRDYKNFTSNFSNGGKLLLNDYLWFLLLISIIFENLLVIDLRGFRGIKVNENLMKKINFKLNTSDKIICRGCISYLEFILNSFLPFNDDNAVFFPLCLGMLH